MTSQQVKTMTQAQMNWNLKKGYAWFEIGADGEPNDDWRMPIWTREGGYLWDASTQRYELLLV